MKEKKLRWHDLLNIWLWHAHSDEHLVQDDTAYVALLRTREWIELALSALETPDPGITPLGEEE